MAKQKKYRVGVYVRLSKEDSRAGESVSIENQKLMLTKHVKEMGWELVEVYQDDGFSGTNQNRPEFQRMLADVTAGYINTILIKDLSRLGRNYLEVGNLAEVFLPEHNCELISLNEKLDDMMVFRNWFNEQHSKTTSIKVKAGKRASAQNGKYVGTYAPYGFKKSAENRHKFVVDENTAPIVLRIFEMRARGIGFRAIAAKLNEDGLIPPRAYYYQGKNEKNFTRSSRLWSENTIKCMVANEVYIGNLVSGKTGTASYKNQRKVRKDADMWIRVEGTHEPIVPTALWDRVQLLAQKRYYASHRKGNERNLFVGLLHCSACGFRLRAQVERRTRKDGSESKRVSYMCSTYGRSGKNACTIHGISEKALIQLVADNIRAYVRMVDYDEKRIIKAVLSEQGKLSYRGSYQNELNGHARQLEKLDTLIENLCEDKAKRLIPDSLYKRQIVKYEQERSDREAAIQVLEKRINSLRPLSSNASEWVDLIKRYTRLETLDHLDSETLFTLIDKIIVHEAQIVDGKRVCDIEVIYNYIGNIGALSLEERRAGRSPDGELLAHATGVR
ncbi:MAG: recombinase family protein [Defluviitaleaceae bacterium]|nr:recombinase family protein [Defluviitaleaceae bacterium]MCL2238411.1 recombinase family protein [Defluviitaleaceae bacterium]